MSLKRRSASGFALIALLLAAAGSVRMAARFVAQRRAPAIEVHAVAHQWWWEFDYPRLGVKVANELHIPQYRRVHLVLKSADVLHSFWLPSMKLAVDVAPGRKRSLLLTSPKAGTLYGSCGAGCGCDGVCMRFRVMVSNQVDFQKWIKQHQGASLTRGNSTAPSCVLDRNSDKVQSSSPAGKLAALLDNGAGAAAAHSARSSAP
jgi:heme/copper-type cytochrome/quinol oxidase subunit 2